MSFNVFFVRSAVSHECYTLIPTSLHLTSYVTGSGSQLLTGGTSLDNLFTLTSSNIDHTLLTRARSDDRSPSIRKRQSSKSDQPKFNSKSSSVVNTPPRKSSGPIGAREGGRDGFNDWFGNNFESEEGRRSGKSKQGRNGALVYGTVGLVDGMWEEDIAERRSLITDYCSFLSASQESEGGSEESDAAWEVDVEDEEPIDTTGMELESPSRRMSGEAESVSDVVYRQLLRRYVSQRENIQTWSDYFFLQEGRRPQLSDVDATRIKFLSDQSRDYLFTRVQVAHFTDSTFRCRQLAEARSRFFHLSTAPVDSRGLNPKEWIKDEVDDWIEAQLGGEMGAEPPKGSK